ncbi:hypothetical protein FRC04_011743 [Tulasnella sp. 424]|nr:hypothetical protein FRC04_011743 [Tulasnella sp. 424]KAG8978088.1 hypothetical protein FRC05_011204 [Tulasnella sp. 425]
MATKWMEQSFFFDWTPIEDPTPVPITAQCEALQIKWSRQTATGPDPVAPYYLQIFTSNYVFPFQVAAGSGVTTNFTVPYAPGTQYQMCMWDSVGSSGGCQAVYTTYAPSLTEDMAGKCANFSFPATSLSVDSSAGQYSWIPSCTDLVLKPTSGTPPYTFTVAPALHPPFNITNIGSEGVTWKVQLQWAIPFFVSMTDSTGLTWSYGPLHAAQGDESCLVGVGPHASIAVVVGTAVGSLILGAVLTILALYLVNHRRDSRRGGWTPFRLTGKKSSLVPTPYLDTPQLDGDTSQLLATASPYDLGYSDRGGQRGSSATMTSYALTTIQTNQTNPGLALPYQAEPFDPNLLSPAGGAAEPTSPAGATLASPVERRSHVYVVHHDSGPAPVSIYAPDGADVVELPPIYSGPNRRRMHTDGEGLPPGAAPPDHAVLKRREDA